VKNLGTEILHIRVYWSEKYEYVLESLSQVS